MKLQKNSCHSARISANKHLLYTDEVIQRLAELSFEEILKYMEEHHYTKSIDMSCTRYEGFYLIERLLNEHASDIYTKVIEAAPKKNKEFLELYYLKYQIHNLMVIIRCKLADEKNYKAYLIGHKKEKFHKAFGMELKDAIRYLCTKLKINPDEVLDKINDLFTLENHLYYLYYERLNKITLKYNNKDEKIFVEYLRHYIDLLNARTLLKLLDEKQDFKELYLQGGNISYEEFAKANSKEDIEKLIGTQEDLDETINAHKKQDHFKKIRFSSPFYPLKFLFAMEKEIAQLRVLLKAKYSGLSTEETKQLIQ